MNIIGSSDTTPLETYAFTDSYFFELHDKLMTNQIEEILLNKYNSMNLPGFKQKFPEEKILKNFKAVKIMKPFSNIKCLDRTK